MQSDLIQLLQDLIQIPSVNPDHAPGTDQVGEANIALYLSEWLSKIGANVVLEEVKPGRPNLIARFAPMDGRPRILLGPHMDTVGVGGMTIPPFAADIHDGCVWGRGASDTKGPMAAMLWALFENKNELANLPIAIDFVAFMGEESCQWGSKQFAMRHAKDYQFALVGEPTSMQIVHVTKGSLWATLSAKGRAAHSSMPERGENAILKLTRALNVLDETLRPTLATYTHPTLGGSTLNLGVIRGGSRPNIVPDYAEIEIDIRITPSLAQAGSAYACLQACITEHQLPLEVVYMHENPPMETDAQHPMIQKLLATNPSLIGLTSAPWFSDAAHLAHAGIPSICMGPGSIEQAHTENEFIKVEDLLQGSHYFSQWIKSFAV